MSRDIKKTKKKIKKEKIIIYILIIFCAYIVMMFTDYLKVNNGGKPFITLKTILYKDGGTKEYYCLGYKFIKYNAIGGRNDMDFGPLWIKYSTTVIDKSDNNMKIPKEYVDIRGQITEKHISDNGDTSILVTGETYADTLYDLALVSITQDTKILKEDNEITISELKEDMNVEITFLTIPIESYPIKAIAEKIIIK